MLQLSVLSLDLAVSTAATFDIVETEYPRDTETIQDLSEQAPVVLFVVADLL
jgi:hypothetical protein